MTTRAEIIQRFRAKAPAKPEELSIFEQYRQSGDWRDYIERYTKIKRKGEGVVSWEFNKAQKEVYDILESNNFESTVIIILKLRQETGMTTLCMNTALAYAQMMPGRNVKSYLQDWDTAKEKFEDIVRLSYDEMPRDAKLVNITDNERTLSFTNRSRYQVQPAKGQKGRAGTVDFLHLSEAAFYDDLGNWWTAMSSSLADNAVLIIESTPNGYNLFREWYFNAKEKAPGFEHWHVLFFPYTDFFDLDNPEHVKFLQKKKSELKEKFPQEYPEDDISCFIGSGHPYLDGNSLQEYLRRIEAGEYPISRFDFIRDEEGVKITPDAFGDLHIFKKPEKGHEYIAGGDVSEGKEDGDWSVLLILDRLTDECVAMYRTKSSESTFADNCDALGRYYKNAWMAIENNGPGHAVMDRMASDLDYPNIYYDTQIEKVKQGASPEPGIRTTAKTKEMHYAELQQWIRDMLLVIPFPEAINEMFSLIKKDGRIEAEAGCHDDICIAASKAVWVHRNNPWVKPIVKDLPAEGTIAEFKYLSKRKHGKQKQWSA